MNSIEEYRDNLINELIAYVLETEYESFTEEVESLQYLADHIYMKAEILKDMQRNIRKDNNNAK